jgi:signal recognition particle subunit SRP54
MTRMERSDVSLFERQPARIERVAKGSGRAARDVKGLIERFKTVRDMMGAIGRQAGLLSKIPGMKQLAMTRQMKGAMAGGAMPGLPGLPGMDSLSADMLQSAVAGAPGVRRGKSSSQKNRDRRKNKDAKKARRRSRKK